MSDDDSTQAGISGSGYVVATMNGETPDLARLVTESVVTLALGSSEEGIVLHGCGWREGDVVMFLEKDHAGVGRDLRTWQISAHDGFVEAVLLSNY